MTAIGIDPSLNSTGICVNKDGKCTYYIISSKCTKKMQEFNSKVIKYIFYEKAGTNKKENEYYIIEENKAKNIYAICSAIKDIIKKNKPDLVLIEGVSYGSLGSSALVDLSGLNFAIRNILIDSDVHFIVVSPSQNKKFATGNGSADKDLMVYSWLNIEKHVKNIKEIKIDDLADAFFLSNYYKALQ